MISSADVVPLSTMFRALPHVDDPNGRISPESGADSLRSLGVLLVLEKPFVVHGGVCFNSGYLSRKPASDFWIPITISCYWKYLSAVGSRSRYCDLVGEFQLIAEVVHTGSPFLSLISSALLILLCSLFAQGATVT